MAEVPEHLLKRSQERRKALGLPVEGDEGGEPRPPRRDRARSAAAAEEAAAAAPPRRGGDDGDAITEDKGGIPAHLLERSRKRKAALAGGGGGEAGGRRRWRPRGRRGDRGRRARADEHRSGRSHPATAHRRQVRFDPAGARRSAGQGARLAAPARDRVRVDPVADGVRHDLLRAGEGAAARSRRREPDAEPVEGAVVLPRPAGAAQDVPPDGRGCDHPRRRARRCSRSRRTSTRTRRTSRPIASSRSS